MELTKNEVIDRINKIYNELNKQSEDWDAAFFISKVNQYYLTGTIQDGVFVLKRDGSYAYFVRRSFERAKIEARIEYIYPMVSYKDVASVLGGGIHKVFMETDVMTYSILERIRKYFKIDEILSVHKAINKTKAVKSEYELNLMIESGRRHKILFDDIIPSLLKEGMNEADFTAEIYFEMVKLGYHGLCRFAMYQTEMVVGQVAFGENSIYHTCFDGPGGMKGMSPAVPLVGDRNRTLKKGDLVFVDSGFGIDGYHSDRTQMYMFGANPSSEVTEMHKECMNIQKKTAALLKPGNIPSEIYKSVMSGISPEFLENFMGMGNEKVKFLGHGIGLQVDEYPVIAAGFDEPLEENMVLAVEPKKSLTGVGLVGVEDTYIVTKDGGVCITGGESDIIVV